MGNDVHQKGGKFLIFCLGEEEYAVDILRVQEIIGLAPITLLPRTPDYIRGVMNLRGRIIPVMDLRTRFGLPAVDGSAETCIVVVREEPYQMGVIVDHVSEVIDITHDAVEEVPAFGVPDKCEYLSGLGKVQDSVKMIVDVHKVLFDVPEKVLKPEKKSDESG